MVGMGIRVDRCGCLRRPMRMVKYAEGVGKKGVWKVCEGCMEGCMEGCEGCMEGCVRGAWRGAWVWQDAIPSYGRSL